MTKDLANPFTALLDAAYACYVAGRYEEAVRIYADVLPRIHPMRMPAAWSFYAESLQRIGRLADAAVVFHQALSEEPDSWFEWAKLGEIYHALGRIESARSALLKALALEPDRAGLLSNLGLLERQLGRDDEALLAYQRAIATDPDLAIVWRNLGRLHLARGDWAGAANCYERLVELEPGDPHHWIDLAAACRNGKRTAESLHALRQALRIDPDNAEATYNLMKHYLAHGEPAQFAAAYARLKTLHAEAARNLAAHIASTMQCSVEHVDRVLLALLD